MRTFRALPFLLSAAALVLLVRANASAAPGALLAIDPDNPLQIRCAATGLAGSGLRFVAWRFGDKTSSRDLEPTHRYAAARSYTVTLVLRNAAGDRQRIERRLDLAHPPKIEIVDATAADRAQKRWVFRAAAALSQRRPRG